MEWLERNRKSVIIAVVLVIAFAAGYFFYKSRNTEQGKLILYGNVDIRQISLAFNSNGRIEEMLKEEGDAVKAGDVLARLDTRPLELAIAQKKAVIAQQEAVVEKLHNGSRPEEITQAAAQVESLAAAENNARAYYQRMASLLADGAVSRQSADDAEARWKAAAANLENAKAALSLTNKGPRDEDIAAAEAQLSALKAGLENDLYNLSQATLVAPQDGVIRSRLMETGIWHLLRGRCILSVCPIRNGSVHMCLKAVLASYGKVWKRMFMWTVSRMKRLREKWDIFPIQRSSRQNLYRRRSSGHRSFMKCAFLWMMKRIASAWECRQR